MSDELTLAERRALAAWSPLAPPASFTDRVLQARDRSRRTLVLGAGVACAAAMVAIVLVSTHAQPPPTGEQVAPPAPRPGYVPVTEIDATIGPLPPDADDGAERIRSECRELAVDRRWHDLARCAGKLARVDPAAAKQFEQVAKAETAADIARARMEAALADGDLRKARTYLSQIADDSVYRHAAEQTYDRVEQKIVDELHARAAQLAHQHRCADLDRLRAQANAVSPVAADAVRAYRCNDP